MVWCCDDSLVVCPVRVVEKMLRPSGVVVCDKFLNVPCTCREIMGSGKLSTCGTCPLTYSPLSVVVEVREVEYLAAITVVVPVSGVGFLLTEWGYDQVPGEQWEVLSYAGEVIPVVVPHTPCVWVCLARLINSDRSVCLSQFEIACPLYYTE